MKTLSTQGALHKLHDLWLVPWARFHQPLQPVKYHGPLTWRTWSSPILVRPGHQHISYHGRSSYVIWWHLHGFLMGPLVWFWYRLRPGIWLRFWGQVFALDWVSQGHQQPQHITPFQLRWPKNCDTICIFASRLWWRQEGRSPWALCCTDTFWRWWRLLSLLCWFVSWFYKINISFWYY